MSLVPEFRKQISSVMQVVAAKVFIHSFLIFRRHLPIVLRLINVFERVLSHKTQVHFLGD